MDCINAVLKEFDDLFDLKISFNNTGSLIFISVLNVPHFNDIFSTLIINLWSSNNLNTFLVIRIFIAFPVSFLYVDLRVMTRRFI